MSDASFHPEEPDVRRRAPVQGACTVAAIAAFAAAAYWALLTFLIGMAGQSPIQMALPFLLIGLYAYRGAQLLKGNVVAAQNLMWLHGIGAAVTIFQLVTEVATPVLLGVKLAIHAAGLVTSIVVLHKARV